MEKRKNPDLTVLKGGEIEKCLLDLLGDNDNMELELPATSNSSTAALILELDKVASENSHTMDNIDGENSHTMDNLDGENSHTMDNLDGENSHTMDNLDGENSHTMENLDGENSHTMDNLDGENSHTMDNLDGENSHTMDNLDGENSHTMDNNLDGENSHTMDNLDGENSHTIDNSDVECVRGKKRKVNRENWKQNIRSRDKVSGKNKKMTKIPACRCECKFNITQKERQTLFEKYYVLKSHTEQTIFLQGCVDEKNPQRHRPRPKDDNVARDRRVFGYKLKLSDGKTIQVCQKVFLAIFNIKKSRLAAKVQRPNKPLSDGRGKHEKHKRTPLQTSEKVHHFIKNLPTIESHYTRSDAKHRKFLSADLSISKIHSHYMKEYGDHPISYEMFRRIFNEDFNISFGYPRKDICKVCTMYMININLKRAEKDCEAVKTLENERNKHQDAANIFFEKMKTFKKMSSVTNDEFNENNTLAICFDYQKNLPLPVTNIQDEYYKRQLWLHNFGIHDLKKNQATMYLYPEHYAQKGPDEVISCLSDYIEVHKTSLQTNLIIFCDNCFSQNKNKFLFAYLDTLTSQEIFSHIEVIYLEPGHSMMPIDSDFGAIEKKRIKEEKVYAPDSYVTLIKNCKKKNPFEIVFVEHSLDSASSSTEENIRVIHVQNYKETMNAKLKSSNPGISKARRLVFQTRSKPMLYLENGKGSAMNLYNVGISKTNFAQQLVYNNKYESLIPVKIAKKKDIEFLIEFIPPEYRDFYRRIPPTEPNAEYLDLDDSDIDFE